AGHRQNREAPATFHGVDSNRMLCNLLQHLSSSVIANFLRSTRLVGVPPFTIVPRQPCAFDFKMCVTGARTPIAALVLATCSAVVPLLAFLAFAIQGS